MRSAFVEATEEMAATLRRSAYSTNVKTRQDFSCAFFDKDLRVVAQAFTQAVHLGSFVALVPRAIEIYGVANLESGDMLVINDPYSGGVHLNDVTVIAPFFLPDGSDGNGELIGYFASLAHHVDVGGGAPASVGAFQEVFQEGIIIPPVKLVKRGDASTNPSLGAIVQEARPALQDEVICESVVGRNCGSVPPPGMSRNVTSTGMSTSSCSLGHSTFVNMSGPSSSSTTATL